jgi:hypothetical protein
LASSEKVEEIHPEVEKYKYICLLLDNTCSSPPPPKKKKQKKKKKDILKNLS